MAIIDIPRNAKTIEYNGVIYDVPRNAAQIEIPDTDQSQVSGILQRKPPIIGGNPYQNRISQARAELDAGIPEDKANTQGQENDERAYNWVKEGLEKKKQDLNFADYAKRGFDILEQAHPNITYGMKTIADLAYRFAPKTAGAVEGAVNFATDWLNPRTWADALANDKQVDNRSYQYLSPREKEKFTDKVQDDIAGMQNQKSRFADLAKSFFGDENQKREVTQQFKQTQSQIAQRLIDKYDFDKVGIKNGELVAIKDGQVIKIDPSVGDNLSASLFEIIGDLGGSIEGAKYGKQIGSKFGKKGELAGVIIGGMLGSGIGGGAGASADYIGASLKSGNKIDLDELKDKAIDSGVTGGVLNAGVDIAAPVIKAVGKPVVGTGKWVADKALKLASHSPGISQITTGNLSGANRSFNKLLGNADIDEITSLYENMPQFTTTTLEATKKNINEISKAIVNKMPKLSQKNKSKIIESTTDLSSKIIDLFNSGEVGAARELFLQVASSSPEGGTIISNILKRNADLKGIASDIVEKPVMQARIYLKEAGVDENALRETMQNYESSTKQDFKDMIEAIDNSYAGVKTSIDPAKLERLADDMYSSFTGDASESFIKRTIDRLLSGEKSIKELNEARNAINENFSSYFQNPNKSYNTLKFANSLKSVIDEGIDDILKQKSQIYEKSRTLYDTALDDYSKMAEARGLDFNKMALNDEALSSQTGEKALKALNNQGGTFKKYVANLSEADAQRVELGAINSLFEKSIGKADNQTEFIKSNLLDSLKGYEFRTKVANETKEFLLNLSKIARGHENISSGLTGVRVKGEGANLATSVKSKFRQKMISRTWENVVRFIPYFGDNAAFIWHLTKGLQGAKTINEFKINVLKEITAPTTDSATRQLLIRYFNETFGDEKKVKQDAVSEVVDEFKQNLKARRDANVAELKGEKLQNKEKRGIYNVTYNSKNSTKIKKYDLDILKDFIKYERGNESKGAIHIRKHLKNGSVGEVSTEEILEMGEVVRKGKKHIEDGRKVFTLYKDDGTRLRVVVGDKGKTQKVITFYSDRNIKR